MNQSSDQFDTQMQAMIRHRRRVAHARTPQEQSRVSESLQVAAMEVIHADPAAHRAFVLRNHRKRTIDKVAKLQAKLMRAGS